MRRCIACRSALAADTWTCAECGAEPTAHDGYLALSPPLGAAEDGGFRSSGFAELFDYEARHFWFRSRNRLIEWAMRAHFPEAKRFFEVGCGTGFVLSHLERALPQVELVGGEAYDEALAFAASRLRRSELYRVDVRSMPFEEEFDVIGAFDVLEHVPEDEEALACLQASTRPGGGLLLTVPQHPWLWSSADDEAHHVRRYTARELRAKVERAGFTILRMTSFVTALLPPMIASRLLSAREAPDQRVQREFAMSPALSRAFEAVLGVERFAIERGASLPLGGSLLLAARRRA